MSVKGEADKYCRSRELRARMRRVVPGGAHTYAKGDDQYPELSPGFIARGSGCHVWDVDGNEFIEYGMGLTGGHAGPRVSAGCRGGPRVSGSWHELHASRRYRARVRRNLPRHHPRRRHGEIHQGRFDAPTPPRSSWRASYTGRDLVAIVRRAPVLLVRRLVHLHDDDGRRNSRRRARARPCASSYNDLDSLRALLFNSHPDRIAAVFLEPARIDEPRARISRRASRRSAVSKAPCWCSTK